MDDTKCPKCGSTDTNCQSGTDMAGNAYFEAWCNACGFSTFGED
jgi:predicted nucleic-acid-binding Zn-ribbon protein